MFLDLDALERASYVFSRPLREPTWDRGAIHDYSDRSFELIAKDFFMTLLHLEALPPQTTRGTIVRLLEQVGGVPKDKIGKIELHGRTASVEVPDDWAPRLVKAVDGAAIGTRNIRVWRRTSPPTGSREDHFGRLLRLLELEAAAEAEQTLGKMRRMSAAEAERSGASLVGLVVRDEHAGLGGRILVTLGKRDTTQNLPWTRLNVGSPVLLSEEKVKDADGWRGVVCGREPGSIQIAIDRLPEPENERPLFRLDLSSDEVARVRQRSALERARSASAERLAKLRDVLLGETPAKWRQDPKAAAGEATTGEETADAADHAEALDAERTDPSGLNASQREAVRFALSAEDVAIIHGPPGTGKTTTVVELIRQAVARGEKVLACAPSNLAVDNIFERLLARGEKAVRLGHPARVLPELREHTLDLIVDAHEDVRLARKLVREAYVLRDKASKWARAKPEPGARNQMREEARLLLADARRLEAQVVKSVLDNATVLCATTTALDSELLGQRRFDLVVIDEACQTTEPGCWIPLLRAERIVLAGDHCQLPPTIVSTEAARDGFGVSLLERLIAEHGPGVSRRLEVQYRMHEAIMEFSSAEFYDGSLEAAPAVRGHLLSDLPGVAADELTTTPLAFVDTAGASYDEELEPDGESRRNPSEADVVARKVEALLTAGLDASQIAVIAPYAAQVRLLRQRLSAEHPTLEIDSVDGFQGREKEAVVISLVRSNPRGEIGFLADVRRMNVALTRARRKLIVIGDSATISSHPFYERVIEYFQLQGAYRTVWEEM